MSTETSIKSGDLLPVLEAELTYRTGSDDSLSDVIAVDTPVVFTMRQQGASSPKIDRADATVVASTAGTVTVRYEWAGDDTDTPGTYDAEFEFDVSGSPLTAPTDGYITVRVRPDLG